MTELYDSRVQSITPDKQRLYFEEKSRYEELEKQVKKAIAERFMNGQIYFQGRVIDKKHTTFSLVLKEVGERILPTLYEKYVDIAIQPKELEQLLEPSISGASSKFMSNENGLGIFELDAGKYQPSCKGDVPSRILQYLTDNNGSE